MNKELEVLNDWFKANKLSLNASKTNYVLFTKDRISKECAHNLTIDDTVLAKKISVNFLVIHIDKKLEWQEHIEFCRKKLASGVYALNSTKRILSQVNLKMLYYSIIHPYLLYGNILWGSAYKIHLNKLVILQKKAVRCITNAKYNEHTPPIFKELMIPNVLDLYMIQLGKFVYSQLNNQLPAGLINIFVPNKEIHGYHTRNCDGAHMKPVKVDIVHRSFIHQGPALWSNIPDMIKASRTVECFGSRLKKYFIAKLA